MVEADSHLNLLPASISRHVQSYCYCAVGMAIVMAAMRAKELLMTATMKEVRAMVEVKAEGNSFGNDSSDGDGDGD